MAKAKTVPAKKKPEPEFDMMKRFHPDRDICEIIPTTPVKRPDAFEEFRPKSRRDCLTYNISQTDAKLDAGVTKIHVKQTQADYEPYPPGYVFLEDIPPPPPRKRVRPQHGRGPVWLFLDEIRKRKIDAEQEANLKELNARLKRKLKMLQGEKRRQQRQQLRKTERHEKHNLQMGDVDG